jgi:Host cell surface-exposed lipoprotein
LPPEADAVYAIKYLHPDWNAEAVDSAKSYLETGGFSRVGLIRQLSSKSGEGFTHPEAVYAVKQLHPDWNAEAVDSAKSYLDVGGFSRASLIDQLSSSYGEGFTHGQAVYAANQVDCNRALACRGVMAEPASRLGAGDGLEAGGATARLVLSRR